jgi:hypothetical protein
MVFEKKWTDEQNKKVLESYKRISAEELAKELNTNSKNVRQRFYYLKERESKRKKKNKKIAFIGKKIPKREIPNTEHGLEVIGVDDFEIKEAPHSQSADEFTKEYQTEPLNKEEEILENEKPAKELPQISWKGFSKTITKILEKRFIANNLAPLTEEEKDLFSDATNQVLELRAKFYFQYADIANLGLATFTILTPRILEFLERKKQYQEKTIANQDLTIKEIPQEVQVIDEQAEATKRYLEATQKING